MEYYIWYYDMFFNNNNNKFSIGKFIPNFDNKGFINFIALLYFTILLILSKESIWSMNCCISCGFKPKGAVRISDAIWVLLIYDVYNY